METPLPATNLGPTPLHPPLQGEGRPAKPDGVGCNGKDSGRHPLPIAFGARPPPSRGRWKRPSRLSHARRRRNRIIILPRRSARRLAAAGEEGRFGTLRPLSAAARRDVRRFRSVPKRGFAFSSTSRGAFGPANPGLSHSRSDRFRRLGLTERLSLFPVDGRETPVRRRAACPGTGVAVPDGAGPRPRSLTRETRPCVGGSEGRYRNIFSVCQGAAVGPASDAKPSTFDRIFCMPQSIETGGGAPTCKNLEFCTEQNTARRE